MLSGFAPREGLGRSDRRLWEEGGVAFGGPAELA